MPVGPQLSGTSARFYPSKLFARTRRRKGTEVLIETFIRKQLRLKAHTATRVEETDEFMAWAGVCCDAGCAGSAARRFMTSGANGNGGICPCGSCR